MTQVTNTTAPSTNNKVSSSIKHLMGNLAALAASMMKFEKALELLKGEAETFGGMLNFSETLGKAENYAEMTAAVDSELNSSSPVVAGYAQGVNKEIDEGKHDSSDSSKQSKDMGIASNDAKIVGNTAKASLQGFKGLQRGIESMFEELSSATQTMINL